MVSVSLTARHAITVLGGIPCFAQQRVSTDEAHDYAKRCEYQIVKHEHDDTGIDVTGDQSKPHPGAVKWRECAVQEAVGLLESIPKDYPQQVGLSLRAYGNLIKHAVDSGDRSLVEAYLDDLQTYAQHLKDTGLADDYPMLARRMSQLLNMGGDPVAACQ